MTPTCASGMPSGCRNSSRPAADSREEKGRAIRITRPLPCAVCGCSVSSIQKPGSAAASFLRRRLTERESIIDLISLIFGAAICEMAVGEVVLPDDDVAWRHNVASLLASLRTDDGGFAKTPEGRAGSTYQTFLAILCHELIELPIPDVGSNRVVSRLTAASRRRLPGDPGGQTSRGEPDRRRHWKPQGTRASDPADHAATASFLAEMQSDEGGLTANTRIPFADLLSTFTGLLTLADLDAISMVNVEAINRYALTMQSPRRWFRRILARSHRGR